MTPTKMKIAVVGSGITGLAAALHLKREAERHGIAVDFTLLEAGARLGGKIGTVRGEGFLIETGPDSFAARSKDMLSLLQSVGLGAELVRSPAAPTYVYTGRKLHAIPAGMMMGVPTRIAPLLATPLLSGAGKFEALVDLISRYPERYSADESVACFLGRRFGAEFVERVAAPLLEAIHADTVEQLSAKAALPGFEMLAGCRGSLIRALARAPSTARPATGKRTRHQIDSGPLATVGGGLEAIVAAIERELPREALRLSTEVAAVEPASAGYVLHLRGGGAIAADAIILAVPAAAAGTVLGMPHEFLALTPREPATVANVALAYRREALPSGLRGTGLVVAAGARCAISAASFVHVKWPHAVPAGHALLRCHVDFARAAQFAAVDDARLAALVRRDLDRILGIKANPEFELVTRWVHAMPRYAVGHFGRLAALKARVAERFPGVFIAGASYGGAGLASCVTQGTEAAAAAFAHARLALPHAAVAPAHIESDATPAFLAAHAKETEPC
ncbi:MAG: protoporphyrinogen oxidase [Burkholderiaceae bacterium]|nr:MAG: protoporphyrinogen oxidase [Burkholderiaceae bacterium]